MSTTPVLNFDFSAVLASLDPHHSYTATLLSGGLMNLTARVAVSADDGASEHECLVRHTPTSVVAKHAPPYIAAFGENATFSQFRQTIEARALKLLSQPITHSYIHANPGHNVTHPEFIRHDSSVHVLLMSDIGHDSLMLDQWLLTNPSLELAAQVGERFGMFLARLGGVKSLDLEMEFANPDMQETFLESYIEGLHANLLKCGVESTEADTLVKLGVDMRQIQESRNKEEKVFGMGDCWVRSILVFGNAIGGEVGLAAIDWEFAGMIEPLADLFQLAATLYLLYQTSPSLSRPTVQACVLALIRTHAAQAPRWYYAYSYMVDAWRLFGETMICNLVDTDLFGGDEQKREAGRKALGKKGTEFIRNAEHMATRGMDAFEMIFTEAV